MEHRKSNMISGEGLPTYVVLVENAANWSQPSREGPGGLSSWTFSSLYTVLCCPASQWLNANPRE